MAYPRFCADGTADGGISHWPSPCAVSKREVRDLAIELGH